LFLKDETFEEKGNSGSYWTLAVGLPEMIDGVVLEGMRPFLRFRTVASLLRRHHAPTLLSSFQREKCL